MPIALALVLYALTETSTSALTFTLTTTTGRAPRVERVEIHGHRALGEDVYRALVALPEDEVVGASGAARIARRMQRFLRLAGYDLAVVRGVAREGRLVIHVDEGHLERIVFSGGGGLGALRLQLLLDLPHMLFNRPALERQLDSFRREQGIRIESYRLVPVRGSTVGLMQLADLGSVGGVALAPGIGRYELLIFVDEPDLPPGLGLELEGAADGLVAAVRYRFAELLLSGDRLELAVLGGLRIGKVFGGQDELRWVSRAGGRASWYSPELFGWPLRGVVQGEVVWWNRARLDLGLTRFDFLALEPTAALRLRPTRFLEFWAGAGVLWERLLSLEITGPGPAPTAPASVAPLVYARAEMGLGDEAARLDQLHHLELGLRHVFGEAARTIVSAGYRKTFGVGWDDLMFHARVVGIPGAPPFYALERAADSLKGLSADRLYSRWVFSAGVEYRISLLRELYKVGAFYDGAVFERESASTRSPVGYAQAFGFGAHVLLLSTFRLSFFLAFGFADRSTFEQSLALSMSQVF